MLYREIIAVCFEIHTDPEHNVAPYTIFNLIIQYATLHRLTHAPDLSSSFIIPRGICRCTVID